MSRAYDLIVVGGGVIGCAVTAEMARRGWKVALLERDTLASGASGVAAGMLAPQVEAEHAGPWLEVLLAARNSCAQDLLRLGEHAASETGYCVPGVLRVANTEAERATLRARGSWQRQLGLRAEWLEPADTRDLESGLNQDIAGALWLPDEAQITPGDLVQVLARGAVEHGAHIYEHTPVVAVDSQAGRVTAVSTPTGSIACESVLLAAGAWTPRIAGLPQPLPIQPIRGEILPLHLNSEPPRRIIWGEIYAVPRPGHQLLLGATEEATSDLTPSSAVADRLAAAGRRLLPALAGLDHAASRVGLRPAAPDRLPVLGPVEGLDGLHVAGGHYRNGVLLALMTGRLAGQWLSGEPCDIDLAPYSPARLTEAAALPLTA